MGEITHAKGCRKCNGKGFKPGISQTNPGIFFCDCDLGRELHELITINYISRKECANNHE